MPLSVSFSAILMISIARVCPGPILSFRSRKIAVWECHDPTAHDSILWHKRLDSIIQYITGDAYWLKSIMITKLMTTIRAIKAINGD